MATLRATKERRAAWYRERGIEPPTKGGGAEAPPPFLSSAWLPRNVHVSVDNGERVFDFGPFTVQPPTVKTALTLLEVTSECDDYPTGDQWATIRWAARTWLPLSMSSLITGDGFSKKNAIDILLQHLAVGAEDREVYRRLFELAKILAREANDPTKVHHATDTRPVPWSALVADYRRVFNVSVQEVLDEQWGVFLEQSQHIARLRAMDEMSAASATGIGMSGNEKAWNSLVKRAGLDEAKKTLTPEEGLENLKAIQKQMETMFYG